jgi:hypothetical protein
MNSYPKPIRSLGVFVTLNELLDLLNTQDLFLKTSLYGHIEVSHDGLGVVRVFSEEALLDKFANSKSDDTEQIVLKDFNEKKTLFVSLKEFDAVLVYDGRTFVLSQFWGSDRRNTALLQPVDFEKFKAELQNYFSSASIRKYVS